jgi:hypothetical protein
MRFPCRHPGGTREAFEAFDEGQRRSVAGNDFQRRLEGAACLVPALRLIGGQPLGEAIAQFGLRCGQLAVARHDLEHGLRLRLS